MSPSWIPAKVKGKPLTQTGRENLAVRRSSVSVFSVSQQRTKKGEATAFVVENSRHLNNLLE